MIIIFTRTCIFCNSHIHTTFDTQLTENKQFWDRIGFNVESNMVNNSHDDDIVSNVISDDELLDFSMIEKELTSAINIGNDYQSLSDDDDDKVPNEKKKNDRNKRKWRKRGRNRDNARNEKTKEKPRQGKKEKKKEKTKDKKEDESHLFSLLFPPSDIYWGNADESNFISGVSTKEKNSKRQKKISRKYGFGTRARGRSWKR